MNTEGPDQIRSTMAGVGTELGWVVRDHGYECLTIVRHFENRETWLKDLHDTNT